ncbi:recombinase zinc beta ribbon domain-containing protein [Pseudoroseomonas wenyumeiae]
MLQGLLVCQECGYALCGRRQTRYSRQSSNEGKYHYYRCTGTERPPRRPAPVPRPGHPRRTARYGRLA